jgi:hypothetical protein
MVGAAWLIICNKSLAESGMTSEQIIGEVTERVAYSGDIEPEYRQIDRLKGMEFHLLNSKLSHHRSRKAWNSTKVCYDDVQTLKAASRKTRLADVGAIIDVN